MTRPATTPLEPAPLSPTIQQGNAEPDPPHHCVTMNATVGGFGGCRCGCPESSDFSSEPFRAPLSDGATLTVSGSWGRYGMKRVRHRLPYPPVISRSRCVVAHPARIIARRGSAASCRNTNSCQLPPCPLQASPLAERPATVSPSRPASRSRGDGYCSLSYSSKVSPTKAVRQR